MTSRAESNPYKIVNPSADFSCHICLNSLENSNLLVQVETVCFHQFHEFCLQSWLKEEGSLVRKSPDLQASYRKTSCPICRYEFSMEKVVSDELYQTTQAVVTQTLRRRFHDHYNPSFPILASRRVIHYFNSFGSK